MNGMNSSTLFLLKDYLCARVLSHFVHVQLFVTVWTVAHLRLAPLSMGFSRQEY